LLGLETSDAHELPTVVLIDEAGDQRRLADAGRALDDHEPRFTTASGVDRSAEHRERIGSAHEAGS
jgi:hypothetical protein